MTQYRYHKVGFRDGDHFIEQSFRFDGVTIEKDGALKVRYPDDPLPPEPKPSIKDYAAAEFSLMRHGPVSLNVHDHRESCCTGGNTGVPCKHLRKELDGHVDEIGFCAACGCGGRERARLSTKLHMPKAACKQGVWGFAKGEGILQLKRIGGVVEQVKSIIKGIKEETKGKDARKD